MQNENHSIIRFDDYRVQSGVIGAFTTLEPVLTPSRDSYEKNFAKGLKYFAREAREIGSLSESTMSSNTAERIRSLVSQANELSSLVSQEDVSGSVILFFLHMGWAATTGVFTNVV